MDMNNTDFEAISARAVMLVEQVISSEPYALMNENQQLTARTVLILQYLKMALGECKAASAPAFPPLPAPPAFDPNVASTLYE